MDDQPRIALVTGGARRIGAAIVRALHERGCNVVIHYRASRDEASALAADLNRVRVDSAVVEHADLLDVDAVGALVARACARWGALDVLVNNASSFYPTPVGATSEAAWDDLVGTNLKAPYFAAQAAA